MPVRSKRRIGARLIDGPYGAPLPPGVIPDDFRLGIDQPTAANTGRTNRATVPAAQLPDWTGAYTITTAGADISGYRLTQPLVIRAANVRASNNEIVGPDSDTYQALVDCRSAECTGFVSERNTYYPRRASNVATAVIGHDYTSIRDDISDTVDGYGVYNTNSGMGSAASNVKILGSYVHDLAYFTPFAAQQSNDTHNDCIQVQGGTGTLIRGATLSAFGSSRFGNIASNPITGTAGTNKRQVLSCVIGTPNVGSISGLQILDSWLFGAYAKINISDRNYGTVDGFDMSGNRFGRDGHYSNPTTIAQATYDANVARWANNQWVDTLAAIAYTRRTGT